MPRPWCAPKSFSRFCCDSGGRTGLPRDLIPLREHEPLGRQAIHFHRITAPWLRRAAQWHGKVALETGLLRWSTLNQRVFALTVLDAFLAGRGVTEPRLAADPARVRQLMQDFLGHVRASRATR